MSAVMVVPEASAKKLFAELGVSSAKSASPAKLAKMLTKQASEDSDEELDLSPKSLKLFEQAIAAVAKDRKIEVQGEDDEEDEDTVPVKKAKKTDTKASTNGKAKKAAKPAAKSNGEPGKKTQERHRLDKVLAKGPIALDELHTKAKVTEKRAEGHVNWLKSKGWATVKKGRVILND